MQTVSSLTPCAICERLLSTDDLDECRTCRNLTCANPCSCSCDRPTSDEALAAALKFLRPLTPLPDETLIVEDEYGAIFGVSGPMGWLLKKPGYEASEGLEHYLPAEFSYRHEHQQQKAVSRGRAGYLTEHWVVSLKRFEIKGRVFTVAVFGT